MESWQRSTIQRQHQRYSFQLDQGQSLGRSRFHQQQPTEVFAVEGRLAVVPPAAGTDGFAVEVAASAGVSVEHTVEIEP